MKILVAFDEHDVSIDNINAMHYNKNKKGILLWRKNYYIQ